jgi:hypothetical protein
MEKLSKASQDLLEIRQVVPEAFLTVLNVPDTIAVNSRVF